MYFYVSKSNTSLHEKIRQGFEMAIAEGAYDELFFNHPMIRSILDVAKLKERKVLRITNPMLTPRAPIDRPELWMDIEQL